MERIKSVKSGRKDISQDAATTASIAVIGIGNMLLKDDGIGVHVVKKLIEDGTDPCVEIIDGGTSPDIAPLIDESIEHLIIVDAALGGDKPGTIYRFTLDDIKLEPGMPLSLHDFSLVHSLKMLRLLGRELKSVTIFGVEPGEIDFGLEPGPETMTKIPAVTAMIRAEISGLKDFTEVSR